MKEFIDQELKQINFLDERFYEYKAPGQDQSVFYPSVTHILSVYPKGYAFEQWLKDVGNQAKIIAERAAESGSKVHDGIERLLLDQTIPWGEEGSLYALEEWRGLNRFIEFYRESNLERILVEQNVYSHKYKYAGTMDLLCKINGETWLIDHKFGNAIYPAHFQQLVAYKVALEEMTEESEQPIKVDRVGILHLKAQVRTLKRPTEKKPGDPWQGPGWKLIDPGQDPGTLKLAARYEMEPYEVVWENFLRTLGIFYYENPEPKPKYENYPLELTLAQEEIEEGPADGIGEEAELNPKSIDKGLPLS